MQHSASPIKQLSSQQQGWWGGGVVRGEGVGRDVPSQAGAKPAAKLYIKKASRARSILSIFLASPGRRGISKIIHFCTQIPRWLDITITYYLLYKSYVFMVPKPPQITIFWYPKAPIKLQSRSKAPKRHSKVAAKQQSSTAARWQASS